MDRLKQEIINVDDKVGNRKDFNCYVLKILHQNVQSLSNKQCKLFIVLNTDLTNLDVLCFMEHCLTLRRLMSYIYGAPILDVSRSHTTTQHSR